MRALHPDNARVPRVRRAGGALLVSWAVFALGGTQADAQTVSDEPMVVQLERGYAGPPLPAGTEACFLGGWSNQEGPGGLPVRGAPSASARVVGRLPPPFRFAGAGEAAPAEGFRTEFNIIGHRHGWFLIEGARPPGRRYTPADDYPKRHPKPYASRGWVPVSQVGAQFANGGTRSGGLFAEPREDSAWTPAMNEGGFPISADGGPRRILACSGSWALVESHDGVRGWWRFLCSNQVTNCS